MHSHRRICTQIKGEDLNPLDAHRPFDFMRRDRLSHIEADAVPAGTLYSFGIRASF